MNRSRDNSHHTTSRLVFSLLVFVLAALILFFRQDIIDRITVWQYHPSDEVAAIAARSSMNDQGRYYFYASRPAVEDRSSFNGACMNRQSETTAVLGCYAAQRIYLYNVTDEQLDGIKEVTAAHEMLHAAYDRLTDSERTRVDALLDQEAQKITDPGFTSLMAEYEKTEAGERLNELHSIIGTQVASVSPELEAYYSRYFSDRSSVTALYGKYNAVFTQLKASQDTLSTELEQLSTQITSEVAAYNKATAQLDTDIKAFNRKAENGSFDSESEFNNERSQLVARQGQLAATRDGLNVTISTFNTKRQQLAAINVQAEALNRSINSNLNPLPSI